MKEQNLFDLFDMFEDEEPKQKEANPETPNPEEEEVKPEESSEEEPNTSEEEPETDLPWNEDEKPEEEDPAETLHPEEEDPEEEDPEETLHPEENDPEETAESKDAEKDAAGEKEATEEEHSANRAEIEKLKENPEALKEAAINVLKSWLNAKEINFLDNCIADVREAEKPGSPNSIHEKIMREYNDNIELVAGLIVRMENNLSIAEDALQEGKSLKELKTFVTKKAREEAEKKAKRFDPKGCAGSMASIDSSLVYEWAEDYIHRNEEEARKQSKKSAPKPSLSQKKKTKTNDTMSLFDII